MTKIEHLLENAIVEIENGLGYDSWRKDPVNKIMLKEVTALPEEIWAMAVYVYFDYKPYIETITRDEIEKEYGYKID